MGHDHSIECGDYWLLATRLRTLASNLSTAAGLCEAFGQGFSASSVESMTRMNAAIVEWRPGCGRWAPGCALPVMHEKEEG